VGKSIGATVTALESLFFEPVYTTTTGGSCLSKTSALAAMIDFAPGPPYSK